MTPKSVNVLGTSGDEHLGGSDFDYVLYEHLRNQCPERWSDSDGDSVHTKGRLLVHAEDIKIKVSKTQNLILNPSSYTL